MRFYIFTMIKFLLLPLIVVTILIGIYIYMDPFKVLKNYDVYYDNNENYRVPLNQGYVSTMNFVNQNKEINYNSFIFGNSRSIFYHVDEWKLFLPENSIPYHFDASDESLWALYKKVEFINQYNNTINNALLVIDYSVLSQVSTQADGGHLFIIPPILINNKNYFKFHYTFVKSFLSPKFIYSYFDYLLSGKLKPYMKSFGFIDDRIITYDKIYNEIQFNYDEYLISMNKFYTPERKFIFYERDTLTQRISEKIISEKQIYILNKLQLIFQNHNTDVKIIISPLYDQLQLHGEDVDVLKRIFGENNVFDFSGINTITNDYTNYYETSHYRPHVASEILNKIYKK